MLQLFLAATSLFLMASCATQLPQTPPAGVAAEVAAPAIHAGSAWRYAVTDGFTKLPRGTIEYRVSAVESDVVKVEVRAGLQESTELYTRDWNWLQRPATNMQLFSYSPAYRAFDFPLAAGKKWKWRGTATDPADGRSFPVIVEGEVLGWEKVKVPAGEFETLKIRRHVFLDYLLQGVRGQSVIMETDWYAPALSQVARRESTSRYLRLAADDRRPFGLVRTDRSSSDGQSLPRYEQDDWLVYELISHAGR